MKLGDYPEMTQVDARATAADAHDRLAKGFDPLPSVNRSCRL